jgi:hypothetical protein
MRVDQIAIAQLMRKGRIAPTLVALPADDLSDL